MTDTSETCRNRARRDSARAGWLWRCYACAEAQQRGSYDQQRSVSPINSTERVNRQFWRGKIGKREWRAFAIERGSTSVNFPRQRPQRNDTAFDRMPEILAAYWSRLNFVSSRSRHGLNWVIRRPSLAIFPDRNPDLPRGRVSLRGNQLGRPGPDRKSCVAASA